MSGSHLTGSEYPIDGRLRLAGMLILLVLVVFLVRLFQLQILEGDDLRRRSQQNSVRQVRLEAPRGEILDREGRVLASTRPAYRLEVVPADLQDRDPTFAALGHLLEREGSGLTEGVGPSRGRGRFRPVVLADDLTFDQLARVETHRFAMPGVQTRVEPRRHYLEGALGAHLLGTIGEIRGDQLEREVFEGYRAGDVIGQTGLEARLEAHLRGREGGRNIVVDAAGREVGDPLLEVPAVPGGRVVLSLDLDVQKAAEQAFDELPADGARRMGAAVALDVRTGDVLALVSRPSFDPNSFSGGIDAASWKELTSDEWDPLQNRALQNHYPPGSTHKALVAAALLSEGVVGPHSTVFCPGFYRFGGRSYRCWKAGGHGTVDLIGALRESCDVYFYTYGEKLGIDKLARYVSAFGIGRTSGLGIGTEAPGLVPSSEWKRRRFGKPWYPGETVSASIGQGFNLYTPMQLAVAYAALANGGTVREPRLVLRLESQDGITVKTFPSAEGEPVPVTRARLALVRRGLVAVVEERGGTGSRARVPGIRVAGKTGTAQVVRLERNEGLVDGEIPVRHRDHAWFGAFAPADAPEIAVAVFVEHGMHGSSAAAPIAGRILKRYFEKQGRVAEAALAAETR
ncbi:MAG: penicillin-binding protein 2 [Deltaproteobacteria bacterium]|nr:penicillin-binding protein 2 [Deltaproteobacteria bacterium]